MNERTIKMNIEVGYLPKKYYSLNPGGFFPFALEGHAPYVFCLDGFYLPDCNENFLPIWMRNIDAFPLYFCAQINSYWKKDFEHSCEKFNINYSYLNSDPDFTVSVTEIQNEYQFRSIIPFYLTLCNEIDLVLWSTNKDVFSVKQKKWYGNWEGKVLETLVVRLKTDTSIFWIGYDCTSISVISNNSYFSTYEKIIESFPEFVYPRICEYE